MMEVRAKRNKKWRRNLLLIFIILLVWIALAIYWIFLKPNQFTGTTNSAVEIKIKSGVEFNEVADQLHQKGLIDSRLLFGLAAKISRTANQIKAGKYQVATNLSNWEILNQLTRGKVHLERITIPEGRTYEYIASLLQKQIEIDSARFAALVHDSSFAHELGIKAPTLNGYLFPDTYFFTWGMRTEQCIRAMVQQFNTNFPDTIQDQDPELGLTRHELVILASLIEGEVQIDSERTLVSALYRNRLKRGMLLQSCPTVQYLLPEGPRRLLNKDLEIDSPYNTYIYPGLPPGPINNPGKKSLLAAAYPEEVPYLYMVARGDGGHTFSSSHSGHLSAKRKFDVYRRQVNREKRRK